MTKQAVNKIKVGNTMVVTEPKDTVYTLDALLAKKVTIQAMIDRFTTDMADIDELITDAQALGITTKTEIDSSLASSVKPINPIGGAQTSIHK